MHNASREYSSRITVPSVVPAMNRPSRNGPDRADGYAMAQQIQSQPTSQFLPKPQTNLPDNSSSMPNGIQTNEQSYAPGKPSFAPDQHLLLVTLAEEYLLLAQKVEDDPVTYGKLISTALGCFEAVFKHLKLQPNLEAEVRLRYAVVLHEQTNDLMELEETLSQGIMLCERHKMFEMKYNMQYLLCQVLFQRNPRASFTLLENIVKTVEAYLHVPWVYAFRFLRVTLSLQCNSHSELHAAISHLKQISEVAKRHADKTVITLASIMEALLCLQLRAVDERKEQAQRALAVAKGQQLDPAIQGIPNLMALMHVVDLACSLQAINVPQVLQTLQSLQKVLEQQSGNWSEGGYFSIPVSTPAAPSSERSTGVVRSRLDGTQYLVFRWFPRAIAYAFGYLMTGIATANGNIEKGLRPEYCLAEGMKKLDGHLISARTASQPPSLVREEQAWCQLLICHMRINLIFLLCARTAWADAKDHFAKLVLEEKAFEKSAGADISLLLLYLQGLVHQGTGFLDLALECFQHESLRVPPPNQSSLVSQLRLEISVLAALNTILVVRSPTHPMHHLQSTLFESIKPYCSSSTNKSLSAAYNIVQVASPNSGRISDTKDFLKSALTAAKMTANSQLKCVALILMNKEFYTGVFGTQSEQSARASQSLAVKSGDSLWMSVSAGLLATTYEVQGKTEEALVYKEEGLRIAQRMPRQLQRVEEKRGAVQVMM